MQNSDSSSPFVKGPKRKRLAKACDACHKSKRRCDGTGALIVDSYYASKQCTYTDASGRPVPAPRPFKPEKHDPHASASSPESRVHPPTQPGGPSGNPFRIYPSQASSSHQFQSENSDDERRHPRKRLRTERGNPMPVEDLIIDPPLSDGPPEHPAAIDLDPALTRELTNLFFTHCHPARVIIHKPTFSSALSHNRVPSHLLLAVCALAAPLSKQPRIRTTPSRFAGKPFAQEALSQMFDGAGRLVVEPDLAAAQALCILQMHDILTEKRNSSWSSRFHDLALQIVEGLGVHSPEHPTLTPVPSQEFVQRSIEREAVRRIFWLIHLLDVMASIYFKKPVTFADNELRLRLPVDETSFELGVHSTLPEYLYLPAVRTQWASEFGHLIRVISIYAKMEFALDEITDATTNGFSAAALMEAEQRMEEWDRTLPDHLRFSEENLQVQQSMFETSSNGGAWCWCCIHLYHASCALVLNLARQRTHRGSMADTQWAVERIELILKMLGDRAKNSILMGSALWSLIKYCKRDDPQVRKWAVEYEEAYGTQMFEMVQDWRSQPSPPHLHQHVHSSQPQAYHQQPQTAHNNGNHHSTAYHAQQLSVSHRRLSDVRTAGPPQGPFTLNTARSPHHHTSDSYGSNGSSSTVKRSPSHSPPISYPLGGRASNTATSSSSSSSNSTRPLAPGLHDARGGPSGAGSGANLGGPDAGLFQAQQPPAAAAAGAGKYGSRDAGHQGGAPGALRWAHMGDDSAGGAGADTGPAGGSLSAGMSGEGKAAGDGGGAGAAARGFGPPGDGTQSLPSLKASGLLDSWGSASRAAGGGDAQKAAPGTQQTPRRSAPSGAMHLTLQHAADVAELRPSTTLGMPVGMSWLANESR
ncbi:hypothetical protein HYPSUDRAFT_66286 [Hypholoma sublateritium FD-334 SS-4]|uniref:Xylanolytic transcriptional activator regulatory domain-containing protein n=1 Tax=Hypholoma sublateritium (strain FD-334 SS-4) TaxID=945553 RepID=A0A0D2NXZ5_HYPSF|nr:hypothetical protein HYPSUDRAFT_66286 [Hypholoma sublateritium FD-334 SS-4]